MSVPRFDRKRSALLVVDLQEKLLPHMDQADRVERQACRLIDGANALGIPVLVTEQYRKGLGTTVWGVASRLGDAVCNVEKMRFSACIAPILEQLHRLGIRQVVVCGIETHVCILQSCLDLVDKGFVTAVAVDAVGSRRAEDSQVALLRLGGIGVVPTSVESILLEWVGEAGTDSFKRVLPLIRDL